MHFSVKEQNKFLQPVKQIKQQLEKMALRRNPSLNLMSFGASVAIHHTERDSGCISYHNALQR